MYQARNTKRGGEIVALKKMRTEREKNGIPVSELQEMTILLGLETENIVEMKKTGSFLTAPSSRTSNFRSNERMMVGQTG